MRILSNATFIAADGSTTKLFTTDDNVALPPASELPLSSKSASVMRNSFHSPSAAKGTLTSLTFGQPLSIFTNNFAPSALLLTFTSNINSLSVAQLVISAGSPLILKYTLPFAPVFTTFHTSPRPASATSEWLIVPSGL